MDLQITARFYVAKGGALKLVETDEEFDSFMRRAFNDGSIMTLTVNAQTAGSTAFCQAPSKYWGTCDSPLYGSPCTRKDRHATPEEIAEREAEREASKAKAK
jgi:hypothetical protein